VKGFFNTPLTIQKIQIELGGFEELLFLFKFGDLGVKNF